MPGLYCVSVATETALFFNLYALFAAMHVQGVTKT